MNASATLATRKPVMAYDGPAAGIGGSLLSRLDLSEDEVVKDFAADLRRCSTNADYAAWALKWGELAARRLVAFQGMDEDMVTWDDHEAVLDAKRTIEDAADVLIEEIGGILKDSTGKKTEAINVAVEKFAAVLAEHEEREDD